MSNTVLLYDHFSGRWLEFSQPLRVLAAFRLDEVLPALREVETATQNGWWAAGFVTYEAAPAFGPARW